MNEFENASAQVHVINVEIAKKYGVEASAFLSNLCFWICQNIANKRNFYEGKYWTYNSQDAYTKLLPYFSKKQLEYLIAKLKKEGVILIGNFNKTSFDRTCWYSVSDEILALYLGKNITDTPQKTEEIPESTDSNNSETTENTEKSHFLNLGNAYPKNEKSKSENQEIDILKKGNPYPKNEKLKSENQEIDILKKGNPYPKSAVTIPDLNNTSSNPNLKTNSSASVFTQEEKEKLKKILQNIDNQLIFSEDFYPKAFQVMQLYSLDSRYVEWVFKDLKNRNPKSLLGLFYSLFAKQETIERYFAANKHHSVVTHNVVCVVCENQFDTAKKSICPICHFDCTNQNSADIEFQKQIWALPENARIEYQKEIADTAFMAMKNNAFKTDFRSEINKKYGLKEQQEVYDVF